MNDKNRTTCPFCSLHCADLSLSIDGGRLMLLEPGCALAAAGYRRAAANLVKDGSELPGQKKGIKKARTWLKDARQPLVVLSGTVDCEAVSAAITLARKYSAVLACDEDLTGEALGLALKSAGCLGGTLGDLRGLPLVVTCGVDPSRSHPRLLEFFGEVPARRVLTLDFHDPLVALRWLRLAATGSHERMPSEYSQAASRIESAASGLVIFGTRWVGEGQPFTTELMLWLRDLNRKKRWYSLYLAPASNNTGVVETLLAETGHPGNLRFSAAGVDHSPRLWRAEHLIHQGAVDVCLLAGEPRPSTSETISALSRVRTVLLAPQQPTWAPSTWLPIAEPGVDAGGSMLRLDGVPVELYPVVSHRRTSMKDLLLELCQEAVLE